MKGKKKILRRDNRDNQGNRDYKGKGKKYCYIAEEDGFDSDSNEHDEEIVYVTMTDESNEDEKTTLISHVNKNYIWIIDSGFSHHMTSDTSKFEKLDHYNVSSVNFGNDATCYVKGKRSIIMNYKIRCDNVYWIYGFKYNFLSVA